MKSKITALVIVCIAASLSSAQDDVFLSLTKKAEKTESLPTNTSVITQKQIESSRASNLGELLADEAGISVGETGTLGSEKDIIMRGASPEEVLILIDGRRVNDVALGLADLSIIPVQNIEKVEIVRGAASAVFGTGAIGGVVNVITKTAQSEVPKADISVAYGDLGTVITSADVEYKKNKTGAYININREICGGYRQNSEDDGSNLFFKVNHDTNKDGSFVLTGSFLKRYLELPGQALNTNGVPISPDQYNGATEKLASTPNATQNDDSKYVRIDHSIQFSGMELKSDVYSSLDVRDYQDPSFASPAFAQDFTYSTLVYGGETMLSGLYGADMGFEWWEEQHKQTDNLLDVTGIDRSRVNNAVFMERKFTASSLSIIPGLRYDNSSAYESVLSPRLTMVYKLSEEIKFSLNASRGFRAPTFDELYYPQNISNFFGTTYVMIGNPNLKPEDGVVSDLGVEYTGKTFKAKLTGFNSKIDNLIPPNWTPVFNPATNTYTYQPINVGEAQIQGLEAELSNKICDGLYHKLNYTYTYAQDIQNNVTLAYDPCDRVNYSITCIPKRDTKINIISQYVSSQLTGLAASPKLPEYATLALRVTQRLGSDLELWFVADNITETQYQTRLGYPLPGRTIGAGVKITFLD